MTILRGFRCPHSRVVGVSEIKDFELEFRGVATIVPKENASVPVLIWELDERDLPILNRYEGWINQTLFYYFSSVLYTRFQENPLVFRMYIMKNDIFISAYNPGTHSADAKVYRYNAESWHYKTFFHYFIDAWNISKEVNIPKESIDKHMYNFLAPPFSINPSLVIFEISIIYSQLKIHKSTIQSKIALYLFYGKN